MARPYKTGVGERVTVYIPREMYLRMIRAMASSGTRYRNTWLCAAIESAIIADELKQQDAEEIERGYVQQRFEGV